MSKRAIILHQSGPGSRELRLGRILDFFGVPWKFADLAGLTGADACESAVFGSIQLVAAMLENHRKDASCGSCYAYLDDDRARCEIALQSLVEGAKPSIQDPPGGKVTLHISNQLAAFVGPMGGLSFSARLKPEDGLVTGLPAVSDPRATCIIAADNFPVFLKVRYNGASIFFCAASQIVDINEPVRRGFYDVKDHICSAVPLVMFIKSELREVAWHPQELSACLIIDDPLLKLKYGFCDFSKLRDLMRQNGFTTNVAFIPWNWRRTSPAAGKFFNNGSNQFSVSIHGCDHTADEFASTSSDVLRGKAQLALQRMQNHEQRTGIQHDLIMVFPQGAFSSICPEVLKECGFIAAVNTEIAPMDSENQRTRISDVWDVAIMTYGGFPIFTRRYPFHGLENFAFDLLLGKPCLIVAHHDLFEDGGMALIDLIKRIQSLNGTLHWRPLGEVIRRACRLKTGQGKTHFSMYGGELLVDNDSDRTMEFTIRKRSGRDDLISKVLCEEKPIPWLVESDDITLSDSIGPYQKKLFRVIYREAAPRRMAPRSLRVRLNVAARRILSEIRDQYLSTNRFLSGPAARMKTLLRKTI